MIASLSGRRRARARPVPSQRYPAPATGACPRLGAGLDRARHGARGLGSRPLALRLTRGAKTRTQVPGVGLRRSCRVCAAAWARRAAPRPRRRAGRLSRISGDFRVKLMIIMIGSAPAKSLRVSPYDHVSHFQVRVKFNGSPKSDLVRLGVSNPGSARARRSLSRSVDLSLSGQPEAITSESLTGKP
jgi:hypothetical protein